MHLRGAHVQTGKGNRTEGYLLIMCVHDCLDSNGPWQIRFERLLQAGWELPTYQLRWSVHGLAGCVYGVCGPGAKAREERGRGRETWRTASDWCWHCLTKLCASAGGAQAPKYGHQPSRLCAL